ncbi:MAG: RluA family pseudouridine synthase [Candidatus Wildermuthbacteria bacterium]|nr:RluA family pseudouridine synthase [Candidatus Wildermuthbacteria bacterium]
MSEGLKILYEDDTLLVLDKPAGFPVWQESSLKEGSVSGQTIAHMLKEQFPTQALLGEELRYGIAHRLDKDTSGVLLAAKTKEMFTYLQAQFKARAVEKTYVCLVQGQIKRDEGTIDTLLGRAPQDRRKQKAYSIFDPNQEGKRRALTEYRVIKRFAEYTLLEAYPKTGRKHQIRAHFAFLGHPLAGDKLYSFKNQPAPEGLHRQFLHALRLKVPLANGTSKEFISELPGDLREILSKI